jgi:hypothetical protein
MWASLYRLRYDKVVILVHVLVAETLELMILPTEVEARELVEVMIRYSTKATKLTKSHACV